MYKRQNINHCDILHEESGMKEKPAASGFLNDENDKVDDENDNEAEKARQDYMHRQHEGQSNEYSKLCTRDRSSSLERSR